MRLTMWAGLLPCIVLACASPQSTGSEHGEATGDGDGDQDDAEADAEVGGDGDGDTEPVPCDVSALPQIEPEWVVETVGASEDLWPAVATIDVGPSALYVTGSNNSKDTNPTGFVESLGLDGTLEWNQQIPEFDLPIGPNAWDGTHIYARFEDSLRRWAPDGSTDGWEIVQHGVADLEVSGDTLVMVGSFIAQLGSPEFEDAFIWAYDKSTPPTEPLWGDVYGELDRDETASAIVLMPSGGWVAAFGTQGKIWLRGFEGSNFDAMVDQAYVEDMFPLRDGVLLAGWDSPPARPWFSKVTSSGEELWRRYPDVCGVGTEAHVTRIVMHEGRLVAWVVVSTGDNAYERFLVEFTTDAEVVKMATLAIDGLQASSNALAVGDQGTYVGGALRGGDIVPARFVAKVDF